MRSSLVFAAFCLTAISYAQSQGAVQYELRYSGAASVSVTLTLPEPVSAPAALVMPRTYPGGYEQVPYDSFVAAVTAFSADEKRLAVAKDSDGPRWSLGRSGDAVRRVTYRVDIDRMEAQILDAVSTSKVRAGYVGLLGYSVFGYVDGLAGRKAQIKVEGPRDWPVISTLAPKVPAPLAMASATAADYDALADSEVLMGPDLKLSKLDGKIPLVMAIYAEGPVAAGAESSAARQALDRVQAYFGDTPFPQYTVQLELLKPLAGHDYDFSQEHIDSGTFSLSTDAALNEQSTALERSRTMFNFAHHMAHCWIPKLVYGEGYRPFTWEMTPVIDTIWFNEGFGRYSAIAAVGQDMPEADGKAFRDRQLTSLHHIVDSAPPFLRRMALPLLSREASFLYAADFRSGMNVFARGALMAAEMDDRIRAQSGGRKSLRDALRWLLAWSAENRKPFRPEDLPRYFSAATGVDVTDILARWMEPLDK